MIYKKRLTWILVTVVLCTMFLFGCQSDSVDSNRMTVAVSIPPLKTITEAVAVRMSIL